MFSMYQGGTHVEVFDAGTTKFCTNTTTTSTTSSRGLNASSGACGDDDSSKKSSKSLFAASNTNNAQSALRQARNQRGVQWQISDARKTVNSRNKKYYESTAKGYVLQLENASIETVVQQHSNTTASSAKARQLTQPMVCAQIYVEKPEDKFTIEFVFSEVETRRDRRRVVLSTAFLETKTSPLHCQVPIVAKKRRATKSVSVKSAAFPNKKKHHQHHQQHEDENDLTRTSRDSTRQFTYDSWVNFIVPIPKLLKKCFGDAATKQKYAIEKIRISGTCLIKRVLTLRGDRLSSGGFFGEDDYVPASVDFPNGVDRKSILFLGEEDEEVRIDSRSTKTAAVREEGRSPARKKQKDNDVIAHIATPARLTYRERRQQNHRQSNINAAIKSSLSTALKAIDTNYEKLTKISSRSPSPPSPPSSFSSFSSARSSRDEKNEKKTVRFAPDTPPNEVEDVEEKSEDARSSHSDGSMISRSSSSSSRSQPMIGGGCGDEDDENDDENGKDSPEKLVSFVDVVPLPRNDLSVRVPNSRRSNLYRDSAEYKSSSESDDDDDNDKEDDDEKEDLDENGKDEQLPPSNWDAALGFSSDDDEEEEEA